MRVSRERMEPMPIPHTPLITTVVSFLAGTKPPATGSPFTGATTNQPISTDRRPTPRPRSHIGGRGNHGRAKPVNKRRTGTPPEFVRGANLWHAAAAWSSLG